MKSIEKKRGIVCFSVLLINLILFFVKLYAAISSNSISIYVDSLNSLADSAICALTIVGLKIASASPNPEFPYGYGKIEELVNCVLSAVIFITGAAFAYSSLQRFIYPVPVWYSSKYAFVIAAAAAVKLFTAVLLRAFNKKAPSEIIKNMSVDSILDFFVSACIVISFTLTSILGYAIDSVTGLAVSAVIIISGFKSLVSSCKKLIGKRNDGYCDKAYNIIKETDGVLEVKSVQCHVYGETKIFTAEIVSQCESTEQMIELSDEIKNKIKENIDSQIYLSFGGNNEPKIT